MTPHRTRQTGPEKAPGSIRPSTLTPPTPNVDPGSGSEALAKPTPHAELVHSIAVAKRFGGKAAHDFNNILAVIHGFAGILQNRLRQDEANRDIAQQIEASALEALNLTGWMSAFANNQARELVLLDFNTVVEEMLSSLWEEKPADIDLEISFAPEALIILGDEAQLGEMCRELWENAVEAMPDGGRLRWQTSLEISEGITGESLEEDMEPRPSPKARPEALVRLRVEDTGVGMDQETLQWAFEPFFSTKNGKARGLGLSMVYDTIHAHRGLVRVSSRPGAGAVVDVYLPAQLAQTTTQGESPAPNAAQEPLAPKVLVVDDEEMILTLVQQLLRSHNYEVLKAESGEAALDLFRQFPGEIRAVLLDMTLPGLSGLDTFRRLKELDQQVKVILATGNPHQEAVHEAMSQGARGVLAKPFQPQHLADVVHKALS
jgi:two-component system, cell cycle sensor histidine kinase and response regulator CckA